MKMDWKVSLAALLLVACSGGSADRGRVEQSTASDSQSGAASSSTSAPPATPATAPAAAPAAGPDLSYAVLDTNMEGELPVRWKPVFTGTPRTRLEGGVLWAPAAEVARVLAPQSRVTFEGGSLKVDGKAVSVPARVEGRDPWAAVAPLARHFGAYARVNETDGSVSLWPREALLWLRDHGDPQAPVLQEARAAGLLGSGR